jgi:hypothetical protein
MEQVHVESPRFVIITSQPCKTVCSISIYWSVPAWRGIQSILLATLDLLLYFLDNVTGLCVCNLQSGIRWHLLSILQYYVHTESPCKIKCYTHVLGGIRVIYTMPQIFNCHWWLYYIFHLCPFYIKVGKGNIL